MIDELGLFDELQNDFTRIFTKLGYSESELTLPRKNVTPYDPSEFDVDFIDRIIRKRCALDLHIIENLKSRNERALPAQTEA